MNKRLMLRRLGNAITDLAPWRDRRRIGFMHVPRTSGTALVSAMRSQIRIGRSAYAFDRVLFGDFTAFDELAAPVRQLVHDDLSMLPRRADFLAGHMARSTLLQAGRNHLMTILREPRSRLLSHWTFWRGHTDNELRELGSWGTRVGLARNSLSSFLLQPTIACQTDNVVLRMLLWPHPLIPSDDFIDPASDNVLLAEAITALDTFSFADLLENPDLRQNLLSWLAKPLDDCRHNETKPVAPERCVNLTGEMTGFASSLLTARCRLDRILWMRLASQRLGSKAARDLQDEAERVGISRFAALLHNVPKPAVLCRAAA